MVMTKIFEVTNKGKEWAYGQQQSTTPQRRGTNTSQNTEIVSNVSISDHNNKSYWDYATNSFQGAADTLSGMVTSLYGVSGKVVHDDVTTEQISKEISFPTTTEDEGRSYLPFASLARRSTTAYAPFYSSTAKDSLADNIDESDMNIGINDSQDIQERFLTESSSLLSSSRSKRSPWSKHTPTLDLVWMFRNNKNPYNAVRGHDYTQPSSLTAARSLVALVPTKDDEDEFNDDDDDDDNDDEFDSHDVGLGDIKTTHTSNNRMFFQRQQRAEYDQEEEDTTGRSTIGHSNNDKIKNFNYDPDTPESTKPPIIPIPPPHTSYDFIRQKSDTSKGSHHNKKKNNNNVMSSSETASQLAEGTIRALRDLALDEAVELQIALRYWNSRWERPLLSWFEAGPIVWTSRQGYNHQKIGRKVSQLQAVLARRCAAIGELQQHLLRAGWHRGVAQWGVLGQGTQWAAVAGFDRRIRGHLSRYNNNQTENIQQLEDPFSPEIGIRKTSLPSSNTNSIERQHSESETGMPDDSLNRRQYSETGSVGLGRPRSSSRVGLIEQSLNGNSRGRRISSHAQVFVGKKHGEGIFIDDPAFLAEWSVESLRLIRQHLFRAGNGKIPLPFESNWTDESSLHGDLRSSFRTHSSMSRKLPMWAKEVTESKLDSMPEEKSASFTQTDDEQTTRVKITDLPLLVSEVEELLDTMEDMMVIQKQRRLERLRPPGWLRRNWYIVATAVPSIAFIARRLSVKSNGKQAFYVVIERVVSFFRERVAEPIVAIFKEVWQGRESFSDHDARIEAQVSLKKMIRSWLDDTFPEMPEAERRARAESMDVTLLERKKVESMKTFFELNNVVRMSFIEMQYMKKEMMNALQAMDEMISANDISMNLAAVTPTALLGYLSSKVFKLVFYAFLRLGKSREETYASFRHTMTDIERLLVMRDNPPNPPPTYEYDQVEQTEFTSIKPCVLGSDDLGMLMLLIHECRSILWRDRRRFSEAEIRSVTEDLAELAGERGAVSVQQQLSIVGRMCRTYTFLKVISTGHMFEYKSF